MLTPPRSYTNDGQQVNVTSGKYIVVPPKEYLQRIYPFGYLSRDADLGKCWLRITTSAFMEQTYIEGGSGLDKLVNEMQKIEHTVENYVSTRHKLDNPRVYVQQALLFKYETSRSTDMNTLLPDTRQNSVKKNCFEWPKIAGERAEERFSRLAEQWKEESLFMSSISDMVMLPSYQRIIGMGWAAVPLILEDLQKQPQHWFYALRTITDNNPVPPKDAGNIMKMTEAWINWGYQNSIITID